MATLLTCTHCEGFLTPTRRVCPHCDAPVHPARVALRSLATIATGGITSFTLMACYGGPLSPDRSEDAGRDSYLPNDAGAPLDALPDTPILDAADARSDILDGTSPDATTLDAKGDATDVSSDADAETGE